MHHLLEHLNQDIKKRLSKDKDSTVNKTEYRSKRNPTGKPRWAQQTAKAPGPYHLKPYQPNLVNLLKPTIRP